MSTWTSAVLTTQGEALLAKLIEGTNLTITRAVAGSGYVDPADLKYATAVSNPRQTLTMRPVRYLEPGECALPVTLTNEGVTTGYTASQVGLYAQDPDEGEILYFIAQALPGTGTEIPAETTIKGFGAEWVFYFHYGQADSVVVTVSPSNTVTYSEFLDAIQAIYAALALKANQSDLNTTNANLNTKLSKSGGTLTGDIVVETPSYPDIALRNTTSEQTAFLSATDEGNLNLINQQDNNNKKYLVIEKCSVESLNKLVQMAVEKNGVYSFYNLFGEHNLGLLATTIQTMLQNGGLSVVKQIKQGYVATGANSEGTITITPAVNKDKTMLNLLSAGGARVNIDLNSDGNIHYTRELVSGSNVYADFRWELVEFY